MESDRAEIDGVEYKEGDELWVKTTIEYIDEYPGGQVCFGLKSVTNWDATKNKKLMKKAQNIMTKETSTVETEFEKWFSDKCYEAVNNDGRSFHDWESKSKLAFLDESEELLRESFKVGYITGMNSIT